MIFVYSLVLLFPTIEDIKTKKIRVLYPILLCIIKVIFIIISESKKEVLINSLMGLVIATSISIVVLLMSKGGIGLGDILLISSLGFSLETELFLSGLLVTSVISTLFSVFLLATKKATKETKLPFVPFIFAGNLVATCLEVFL